MEEGEVKDEVLDVLHLRSIKRILQRLEVRGALVAEYHDLPIQPGATEAKSAYLRRKRFEA